MSATQIALAVIVPLFSGIAGVVISALYYRRYDRKKLKRDVLSRFVGNRHFLTKEHTSEGEPFIALNEVFVVYADSPAVIAALKKMHEELQQPDRLVDNVVTLIKAMAKAAGVQLKDLNDSFIEKPFTPRRKT